MKKVFLISILYISITNIFSQNITISGYLTDSTSGESLIGGVVMIKNSNRGSTTNDYGFYSIEIDTIEKPTVVFSYLGYYPKEVVFSKLLSGETYIKLVSDSRYIEEVLILSKKNNHNIGISNHVINPRFLKSLPAIAGETDLMHYIKMLPGVQSDEGSSSFSVRGGLEDQNIVLMDGSPVYNVNHFGGVFSLFNTDIVQYAKFYKGAFPSYLGGRLSSVIDVKLKDGSINDYQVQGTLGLLSSKIAVDGPIVKDKSSFLLSARTCMYPIYYPFLSTNLSYNFYDLNLKLNYKVSNTDRIYISAYKGKDEQGTHTPENAADSTFIKESNSWGNELVSLRWNHLFSSRFFTNLTLAYSGYTMEIDNISKSHFNDNSYFFNNYFKTSIQTLSSTLNIDYYLGQESNLKGQVQFQRHTSVPSYQEYQTESPYANSQGNIGGDIIIGDELNVAINHFIEKDIFRLNYGIRGSQYYTSNNNYLSIEPRIAFSINLPKSYEALFAFDKMGQFIHLASSNTVGLPIDYWLPVTDRIKPKKGWQITTGLSHWIGEGIKTSVELYYNEGYNYLMFTEGKSLFGYSGNWEDIIYTNGKGVSRGIEITVEKTEGKYTGAVYATFADSKNRFDEINNGSYFPSDYDRRFSLNAYAAYKINEKWTFTAQWQFGTGLPITLPVGEYNAPEFIQDNSGEDWMPEYTYTSDNIIYYSDKNKYRMESFHRLDIAMVWSKLSKRGTHNLNFSLFNVYARINPYYYYIKEVNTLTDYTISNSELMLYKQGLVPFLPSISYSFNFSNKE